MLSTPFPTDTRSSQDSLQVTTATSRAVSCWVVFLMATRPKATRLGRDICTFSVAAGLWGWIDSPRAAFPTHWQRRALLPLEGALL